MSLRSGELAGIRHDTTPADTVRSYFEDSYIQHIFNPLDNPQASEGLLVQIEAWQAEGKTVVFTSGVYDFMHANHRTYLLHTKIAAARHCWNCARTDAGGVATAWEDLSEFERVGYTKNLLTHDQLKLVVSVDGNMAVAARKGNKSEKGSMPRPLYDWETRVRDVLRIGYELSPGNFRPIVDAVTMHDNVQPELAGTPHGHIMEIANFVRPDVWSVFEESVDITEALKTTHAYMLREGMEVYVLDGYVFYTDKLLGGPVKTTAIARRIGGSIVGLE